MEFLTAVIPVILDPLVAPITRQLGYAFRFRSKVDALRNVVNALQREIDYVRSCIAERGEVPLPNVLDWQTRAETAIAQAEAVIRNGETEAQRGCCSLRLKTRYKIGKQAADGSPGIVRLREERGTFGPNISRLPDLHQIVRPPVEGYEAESRTELLNKVVAALSDPNVAMVGVHGVGGIGKTTLAKEVHRHVTHKKLFDKVVLATVTATPELRRIQDEIAEFVIGSKLQESTDSARASRLNQRLMDISKDTRILIILDDLWDRLDLGRVGIPTGYDKQGCKILLTSRRLDLLSDMGSKKNFPVDLLPEKEAMSLFEREVVEVRDNKIAEEILIKCGGFPLLIVTVAGLVKNKGLHAWKDASTQLSKVGNQDLHDKVYSVLNLSYDRLPSEETKSVFLLCGMCSRTNTTMLDLLRYSLGLGLLTNYAISDARNRLQTLIDDLKAYSLLDVDEEGRVKMHDVVRDMCMAHKDQHAFRYKDGNALKEWPSKGDNIRSCTRVSLPYSDILHLPEDLGCPDVEFLLLFSNWSSMNIPDSTFQGTRQLRVVHFTGMEFAPMPGSLHFLTNLQTLSLERCHLPDVAAIGQLKTLEILSFRESDLVALPSEMGHLTRLKSLDLSHCSQLDFIPADDVISKLTSLEELLMKYSYSNWESEESTARRNARLSELKCLSRLASLEICVSNVQALPRDFSLNSGLERYQILIGQRWGWETFETTTKTLMLKLERGSTATDSLFFKVRGLLEESEALSLDGLNRSKNLLYDLDNQGFPKLKKLHIRNCVELQQIVECRKHGAIVCFPLLETLELQDLTSVATICEGRPAPESFGKIKSLEISGCNKLKNLMSLSMVRSLSQLEEIVVGGCDEMEALFVEEEESDPLALGDDEAVELPRLRRLKLWGLPQLKCFFYVRGSDKKLMSFFGEKVALPNLEELELISIGNTKMIWCNQLPPSSFGKLNSLKIYGCHELRTVFPHMYIVERFQNLKSLSVNNCSLLEEIYRFGDGAVVGGSNSNGPVILGLNKLDLSGLPKLKHMWREDLTEQYKLSFRKLESVYITGCESLKSIFTLGISKSLSELQSLEVRGCDRLEEMVAGGREEEFSNNLFCQLSSLTLEELPELRSLYPDSNTWSWPKLESLKIQGCRKARIFGEQEEASQVPNNLQTFFSPEKVFPNLERMSIDGRIWKSLLECQSQLTHLTRLKTLELSSLNGTLLTEASHQFGSIPTVTDLILRVYNSRIRRRLWTYNIRSSTGFDAAGQPSLRRLELYEVRGLRHVWVPDSHMDHLESLKLECCRDLISLATSSPSASFRNLSTLELGYCSKLAELMKPSTATTMANLVTLRVRDCNALKEIVAAEDDDYDQTTRVCIIVFNKLKTLELRSLDSLEGFCLRSCYSFNFPCLEKVSIKGCPSMQIFCNGDAITPKLQNVDLQGLRRRWDGDLNTTVKQLHQVEMQNNWNLKLSRFPELVERWGRELPFRYFNNLYELVVDKCPLFSVAIPSNILPAVSRCERLVVEKCDSVEEILDIDGMDQNECHVGLMPRVSFLTLMELPKLRHIWNIEDTLAISCFKNLTELYVHKCGKLTHIFILPIALGLVRLRKLEVKECALVEVIIKQQGDEKPQGDWDQNSTIFPQLTVVELENLPSLMGFYSGGDNVKCPTLDRVSVVGCPRICLLSSTTSSTTEHDEINVSMHDGAADEPTLRVFNEQVEILKLREIVVQWNSSMDKAWYEIVPPSFLRSLEFVQLIGFPTIHQFLPSNFAEAMPNLFKFTIGTSFSKQRLESFYHEMHVGFSTPLEYLELFDLQELKHLVVEFFQLGSMLQHLKELRVSKCKGLTRLVTSSMAKSLVNLVQLVVKECERMTEIVSSDGEDVGDEIVFRKLNSLELDDLPCLTSFSSGDYAFSFPQLRKVITRECPNMNTFSKNIPNTPLLDEVHVGEDETDEDAWRWEGELNSTIEKLFAEKNPNSSC